MKKERYEDYTQFDTVWKLCSAFANIYNSLLRGAEANMYLGWEL